MCAFDVADGATRDRIVGRAYDLGLLILGCGPASIRFRPALDVTTAELDDALDIIARAAA